jgi:hypothetical protein
VHRSSVIAISFLQLFVIDYFPIIVDDRITLLNRTASVAALGFIANKPLPTPWQIIFEMVCVSDASAGCIERKLSKFRDMDSTRVETINH